MTRVIRVYIYILGFFYVAVRTDTARLIEQGDVLVYHQAYLGVELNNLTDWFSTEILLPLIYFFCKFFVGEIDISNFIIFQQLLIYTFVGYALMRSITGWALLLVLIVFLDVAILAHVSRQFLSSAFVILALAELHSKKRLLVVVLFIVLSGLSHLTGPVFFTFAYLCTKISRNHLRSVLILCSVLGGASVAVWFVEALARLHAVPVFGKAFFALEVFNQFGESKLRLLSVIGVGIMAFFPAKSWQEKVSVAFLALSMAFYPIPILNSRIGLIGTSIMTGLPFWLVLRLTLRILTPHKRLYQSRVAQRAEPSRRDL